MTIDRENSGLSRRDLLKGGAVFAAVAALTVASPNLPGTTNAAYAGEARAAVTDTINSAIPVQGPTAERPYHYMSFDETTTPAHPDYSVPDAVFQHSEDKLVVINFIQQGDSLAGKASRMQSQVLTKSLAALAQRSTGKDLMLIDVVVRDAAGNDINVPAYAAYYKDNTLGEGGAKIDGFQLPYGAVYGEPLTQGVGPQLFDFALLNGVQSNADLNANAEAIAGSLYTFVEAYNQKKIAALNDEGPVLAASGQ